MLAILCATGMLWYRWSALCISISSYILRLQHTAKSVLKVRQHPPPPHTHTVDVCLVIAGGGCKMCGSVEHKRANCPKGLKQKRKTQGA